MIQHNDSEHEHVMDRLAELGRKVLAGGEMTREEGRELAAVEVDGEFIYDLFYWANRIRLRFVGNTVKLCSIVAGRVGACSEDCGYCSQSKYYRTHVTPGRTEVDEIEQATEEAIAHGASSFGVVNSGRGPSDAELDRLEPYYRKVAAEGRIRPCATLGELTPAQAERLSGMGVQRVNHNLETSRRHFPNIVTTHTYDDRVRTIKNARSAGLSICCGGIFGLGEDWEDRLDMALEIRELGADVVPINFLNAIEGTPVHGRVADLRPMEALKIVAVYRFLLPDRELKIAGGREKILRDLQSWCFFAGASSMMVGNYLTTFGRNREDDRQMFRDLEMNWAGFDEQAQPVPAPPEAVRELSLPVLGAGG